MNTDETILLTGATGYVGGKLLRRLEKEGYPVHCISRHPEKLVKTGRYTKVYRGDVMQKESLRSAFRETTTAYYLVHSLSEKKHFETDELLAAENFVAEAERAGVRRIIYLGALGNEDDGLSPHLESRQQVGRIFRDSSITTIELRASIVIGDGSLSFELIRDLTEHLPVMMLPRWLATKAQPIGITDVLDYLTEALRLKTVRNEVVEIGGSDQMSYGDLMREYAHLRGIRRMMIPVPVLTPRLSSHWIALFSGVNPTVGRKLIEGIRNPTVVGSRRAEELFDIHPQSVRQAMREALEEGKEHHVHAA